MTYKEGDWVYIVSAECGCLGAKYQVGQICPIFAEATAGLFETDDCIFKIKINGVIWRIKGEIRLATKEEIDAAFVLPEKWYVRGSEELEKHFEGIGVEDLSGNSTGGAYYTDENGRWKGGYAIEYSGRTNEITFDQFKKHVLKMDKKNHWI